MKCDHYRFTLLLYGASFAWCDTAQFELKNRTLANAMHSYRATVTRFQYLPTTDATNIGPCVLQPHSINLMGQAGIGC